MYDILKYIFVTENVYVLVQLSLKLIPKGPIVNKLALDHLMGCPLTGDKP